MAIKTRLKKVRTTEINVPRRFREDLGDLDELIESIQSYGVLQPITLNGNMELMAGGRRFEAATRAGVEWIPALIRDTDDELDLREIELIENVHRKDFSWNEKVQLTQHIHNLLEEKHGQWTQKQTAEVINRSPAGVYRHLELANALQIVPDLGNCKSEDEAFKAWKKAQERAQVSKLRELQEQKFADPDTQETAPTDETETERNKRRIYQYAHDHYRIGDAFEGMQELIDYYKGRGGSMIRFIECDPPYAIDLNEAKRGEEKHEDYNEVDKGDYPGFLRKIAEMTYKVAARDAWMIFWYGPTWHCEVFAALRRAGWQVDDIPGIWVKPTGQTNSPDTYLARQYEPFAICRKGKPLLAQQGTSNVFHAPHVPTNKKYHPTQRPLDLMNELVATFCYPNTIALVPFLGSGATLRACYQHGVNAFGWELSEYYRDKFLLEVVNDDE